jgi:hypothetical protein
LALDCVLEIIDDDEDDVGETDANDVDGRSWFDDEDSIISLSFLFLSI